MLCINSSDIDTASDTLARFRALALMQPDNSLGAAENLRIGLKSGADLRLVGSLSAY